MTFGYNKPLYILPFDHRATFQTGMFGWKGPISPEQTARIAAAKEVIYDALKAAVSAGVPKDRAGILVDEQFGAAILRQATRDGFLTSAPSNTATNLPPTSRCSTSPSVRSWCATTRRAIRP
jgi:myo-inositol catabolism protein IolC